MNKLTPQQRDGIIRAYRAGASLAVTATAWDTSVAVVKQVLAEAGIPERKREPRHWMRYWH